MCLEREYLCGFEQFIFELRRKKGLFQMYTLFEKGRGVSEQQTVPVILLQPAVPGTVEKTLPL